MKILIYSDIHISQDSSIIKSLGRKYSTRLENIIDSLNWAEQLAVDTGCDCVCNLGDTFDKPIINAMEATAVQDISWNNLPHYVLVGNHDSNVASLEFSSVSILKKLGFHIIEKPEFITDGTTNIYFLPYITEARRESLDNYIVDRASKNIILSHNDIAGCNFGGFLSKDGFEINEIESICDLFLNGHLHNSAWVTKKILNVGNLTGQNFSEDAEVYQHGVWILDTDNNDISFVENPYAFNFYKLSYTGKKPLLFKGNAVLMIKCKRSLVDRLKEELSKLDIVAYRILIDEETSSKDELVSATFEKIDHLKQFEEFILNTLGSNDIVKKELKEICR